MRRPLAAARNRAVIAVTGAVAAMLPFLAAGTASAAPAPALVYVSPTGSSGAAGTSCSSAAYSVINDAIAAVAGGGRVIVCPGTYDQGATVDKTLTLQGRPGAVIDASGLISGIDVTADGVTVRSLTVDNASQYGILVTGSDAVIAANTAEGNGSVPGPETSGIFLRGAAGSRVERNTAKDDGGGITLNECPQCQVTGNTVTGSSTLGIAVGFESTGALIEGNAVTGSNGDGIFLFSSDMTVSRNRVTGSGFQGIYLTDGPDFNRNNTVTGNIVKNNGSNGIGLTTGSDGGVNDNTIQGNIVKNNAGAGINLDDFSPSGISVSGNIIKGNTISGNSEPGVTLLCSYPSTDASGNVITGNTIGTNNLAPNPDRVPVEKTTGVFASSVTTLSIQISSNVINSDYYGIWLNSNIDASALTTNHFGNVTVPVFTAP